MFANLLKYIWLKIYSQIPGHMLHFFQILLCNAKEIFFANTFRTMHYIWKTPMHAMVTMQCSHPKQSMANLNALSCVTVGQRWQKQQNSKTIIIMIERFS